MSIGRTIIQTTVMVITGSAVSAGVNRGKKWLKDRKGGTTTKIDEEEPKEVGSVTQVDED